MSIQSSCLSGLQYAVRRETKYQMSASVAADAFLQSLYKINTTYERLVLGHDDQTHLADLPRP